MTIISIQDAVQAKLARVLPEVLEVLNGPRHLQYYLGNGKDGYVFRMFNPKDPEDRSFDGFAIKIWGKSFQSRQQEIEIQQTVSMAGLSNFQTPKVHLVDFERGCFVMDRVDGETALRAIFRLNRFIDESLFQDVLMAFRELNNFGILHNDAHTLNYMLTDVEVEDTTEGSVMVDARLWIIDYGRSIHGGGNKDIEKVKLDLEDKVMDESPQRLTVG